jgi:hypothetical protein
MNRNETPPGGFQFHQAQSGWSAPTPVASTFNQTVELIIQHRRANPAMTAQHKLSLDPGAVGTELESYTARRLGLPDPKPQPPPATKAVLSGVVVAAVDNVKKLAAGAAVLFEWENSGEMPVAPELANKRAEICADCPKNSKEGLARWFTVPISETIRRQFEKLHKLSLTTPSDSKLGTCAACVCPLSMLVHTPLHLKLKRMTPEVRADLDPRCWQLSEEKALQGKK